ncbi:hypothetical protein ACIRVF_37600 [Kitasatospora sp. NPDC101157]|uniref:hypothetical protein n=1 Tax=Kitasatospora sp. NPDC101157 TaxID=3364098 RepID=UPI0038176D32
MFDLNRGLLTKGRVNAFHVTKACVTQWADATSRGEHEAATQWAQVVNEQPIADVVQAMLHQALEPAAEIVFDDDPQLLAHLREPRLRSALLLR